MAYEGKHQIPKTKHTKARSLSRSSSASHASPRTASRPSPPPAPRNPAPSAPRSFSLPLFQPLSCLLFTLLYLELLLRATCSLPLWYDGLPGALFCAFAFASAAALICFLPRGARASRVLCLVWMELFIIWYVIAFFMDNSYSVFMSPTIIAQETGNVVTDFGGNVVNAIVRGMPMILLYHVPMLLFPLLRRFLPWGVTRRRRALLLCAVLIVLFAVGSWGLHNRSAEMRARYQARHTYDSAARSFGLLTALTRELTAPLRSDEVEFVFEAPAETAPPVQTEAPAATAVPEQGSPEEERETGPNVMEIDFSRATSPSQVVSLSAYIQTRQPTVKNEYTGIFAGKNLILITAEAFSKEVIDPERTPTLYRMANSGIVFEDFYQPSWGGSTSTGEYSWLTGIAPTNSMTMMYSYNKNLYFTMGNQLQRLGYFSRAYHNGSYNYYDRDWTHQNLGYEEYYGVGNGLEKGLTAGLFPNSDVEMFEYTIPQYIDHRPFSVYYMTISGHASYGFSEATNDMAVKHQAETEKLPNTETVNAYLACNMELEYAMESLLKSLEKAGILDDTVIALVPDHYPYGLTPSAAWGNQGNPLVDLYGFNPTTQWARDHNAAILWCGSLEKLDEPIRVGGPVSSLDILPTLSNLFGLEYDSRLLAGSDVFGGAERLVFWNDYSWLTEEGSYDAHSNTFTPADGKTVDEAYIERIHAEVRNRINLSWTISEYDYYGQLFGPDPETGKKK